jgi:hypothetical protein
MSKMEAGRTTTFLERWLVPSLLVAVGLLQIYLARAAHLSPWKGGGFGMFATIDNPEMRVIAAEALSSDGQWLRLDLVSALDETTWRRMHSLPKRADLEHLAPQLLTKEVVPITIQQQAAYLKLQKENPAIELQVSQSLFLARPLYRLKLLRDPILPDSSTKTLQAVRLQWWQLRFDASQNRLWAEPLSQVVEAGKWQ